jgi:hypothetical protein
MDPNQYLIELGQALEEYRFKDIRSLTDKIDPSAFNLPQIRKALGLIRRKRRFADLEHTASLFSMAGKDDPVIRRQWSQSLLDQGRVSQALAALSTMSQKYAQDEVEGPEIRGLAGRAYKQLFVNEGNAEYLESAIAAYTPDWEQRKGDYRWHGINLVALLSRAKEDGIAAGSAFDPAKIAKQIFDEIEQKDATGVWDYATGMEAAVGLKDEEAVLSLAQKYVRHPDADAFELSSTLRQLKEVWHLEGTDIGNKLLPVLEYAVLQKEGGSVQPVNLAKVPDKGGFEAVYGAEGVVPLQWIDTLYSCCNAIARVNDAAYGAPVGSGFVVSGRIFASRWGDGPLFLTNAHVISLNPADQPNLHPSDAEVEFTRAPERPRVRLGDLVYSSPRFAMDISILRIDSPTGSSNLELCSTLPQVSAPTMERRVYVIGHPGGRELAVSLYDNSLTEYAQQYVRYRSPTEAGNSGSPVFDRRLKCFAIHHRALDDKQLNEGIVLDEIKKAIVDIQP